MIHFSFLHHGNVDRFYHLWQDCQGYENIPSKSITATQYAANPTSRDNPVNGLPDYTFSMSSQIPYYWGKTITTPFPKTNGAWPTPRDMWSTGLSTPGYDGICYRYGKDQLVRGFGTACPDQTWNLVDVGYVATTSKRDDSINPLIQEYKNQYELKVSEGKSHKDALYEMAVQECMNAPKNEITPRLMGWMKMNNLKPEHFDSICDKPSQRMALAQDREDTSTSSIGYSTAVPVWVIISASVGSAVILIAVISIAIFFAMRKRKLPTVENDDLYVPMK